MARAKGKDYRAGGTREENAPMSETAGLTASDGHRLGAYRVGPAGAAKALVVVQEIFGVNAHIRELCKTFADHGYVAMAPSFFDHFEHDVQLRYDPDAGRWTLYCADRNSRWHHYDLIEPGTVTELLAEIEQDPTGIFWG